MCRYGELEEKRRKRSINFERKQSEKIENETVHYTQISNRIKRMANAVYKLPNNDETTIMDTKYPWEVHLFMRLGIEGTGTDTPFGMEYDQPCPLFWTETDAWDVDTYDVRELRRQESEHNMIIKQCSGSLITSRHILTSAECVTTNSEYLRQDINIITVFND